MGTTYDPLNQDSDPPLKRGESRRIVSAMSDTPINEGYIQPSHDGEMTGYVYAVREKGHKNSPVKIGFSKTPIERLKALQGGNHRELIIVAMMPGTYQTETRLHGKLAGCLVKGEWFEWEAAKQELAPYMLKTPATVPAPLTRKERAELSRISKGYHARRRRNRERQRAYVAQLLAS